MVILSFLKAIELGAGVIVCEEMPKALIENIYLFASK